MLAKAGWKADVSDGQIRLMAPKRYRGQRAAPGIRFCPLGALIWEQRSILIRNEYIEHDAVKYLPLTKELVLRVMIAADTPSQRCSFNCTSTPITRKLCQIFSIGFSTKEKMFVQN